MFVSRGSCLEIHDRRYHQPVDDAAAQKGDVEFAILCPVKFHLFVVAPVVGWLKILQEFFIIAEKDFTRRK